MFKDLCIDAQSRDRRALLVSFAAHLLLLAGLIIVPLAYYEQLPDFRFIGNLRGVPDRVPAAAELLPDPIEPIASARPPEYVAADPWVVPSVVPDTIPPPDSEAPDLIAPSYRSGAGFPTSFPHGGVP
jgi:hypothetical protein